MNGLELRVGEFEPERLCVLPDFIQRGLAVAGCASPSRAHFTTTNCAASNRGKHPCDNFTTMHSPPLSIRLRHGPALTPAHPVRLRSWALISSRKFRAAQGDR